MGNHETTIHCSVWRWWRTCQELRRRGGGVRESGAFLLGRRRGDKAFIERAIYYDDIDPNALATGIVRLNGASLATVWRICRENKLDVIADVHTHPGGAGQSNSDQQHPMISKAGHVALILPDFVRQPFSLSKVGVYRYDGAKQWTSLQRPFVHWFTVRF